MLLLLLLLMFCLSSAQVVCCCLLSSLFTGSEPHVSEITGSSLRLSSSAITLVFVYWCFVRIFLTSTKTPLKEQVIPVNMIQSSEEGEVTLIPPGIRPHGQFKAKCLIKAFAAERCDTRTHVVTLGVTGVCEWGGSGGDSDQVSSPQPS